MALDGARNAKALAWNNGSLEAKHTQKHNKQITRTHTLTKQQPPLLCLGSIYYVRLTRKAFNPIMRSLLSYSSRTPELFNYCS